MDKGLIEMNWIVNDQLTAIPSVKTFWHDLLDWLPNSVDKTNGYTPYHLLAEKIESDLKNPNIINPNCIIRNATFFRRLNTNIPTFSLLQDIYSCNHKNNQINVCNHSKATIVNSQHTYNEYKNEIHNMQIIPLGVDHLHFKPLKNKQELQQKYDIKPNSIIFIGDASNYPKGYDKLLEIVNNTSHEFVFVFKSDIQYIHPRVKMFNKVNHDVLVEIINACSMGICTSIQETQHLSGIEIMLCNLPIVSTNVGLYTNNPYENEFGIICKNSYDEFIPAIDKIMKTSYSPRNSMLKQRFAKKHCCESWQKLIEEI